MDSLTDTYTISAADYALLLRTKASQGEAVFSCLGQERWNEWVDTVYSRLEEQKLLNATELSKLTGIPRNTCHRFITKRGISGYNLFALSFVVGLDPILTKVKGTPGQSPAGVPPLCGDKELENECN